MDKITTAQRREIMQSVKSKNTGPEMRVRTAAHNMGLRFRLHVKELPGKPDLVFPKWRICIFVNGCFWHRHKGCPFSSNPKSNRKFWSDKFKMNVSRDINNANILKSFGWHVEVIWECETKIAETLRHRLENIFVK